MANILFQTGEYRGQGLRLEETGVSLGRSYNCDVTLTDDSVVSAEHASIRFEQGAWWLYDLRSTNGTFVNGQRVEAIQLSENDKIKIGSTIFEFHENESELFDNALHNTQLELEDVVSDKPHKIGDPTIRLHPKETIVDSPQKLKGAKANSLPNNRSETIYTRLVPPKNQAEQRSFLSDSTDDIQIIKDLNNIYLKMKEQLSKVIVGQEEVIDQVLMSIFCRSHSLLIGVPGVAKTLLINSISHVLKLSYKRLQFTPDLMPSDITGTDVLEEDPETGRRRFRFVQGPIFANMVLADEINRTPPKTQAALLEAMQEHRVTVGGKTYHLPEPFFVLATQNPIEQEGTYPLPEAQLDRFMFNIVVDYPKLDEERMIIKQVTSNHQADLDATLTAQDVLKLQQLVKRIPVADHVINYACDLARGSRPNEKDSPDFVKEMVSWGAGPRAGINLVTAAKAHAILNGRQHTTTEDITYVALPVLRHRIMTTFNAESSGITSNDIVKMLIEHYKPKSNIDV